MTKNLRPVSTFDQLVNLPIPQLTPPERTIETSRPDPNVFDFHEGMMGQQQNLMHMHAMHEMMMQQQAGMMMPPAVFSSASTRRTSTRSCNGRNPIFEILSVVPKAKTGSFQPTEMPRISADALNKL